MHSEYFVNGIRVPSVTEVISILSDYSLLKWANRLGFSFIDVDAYLNIASQIGSETHDMIASFLRGEEFTPQLEETKMYFERFLEFSKSHKIEPILIEHSLISERYLYGGTLDLYCNLDGVLTLIDFKTGYYKRKHDIQLSAYRNMLQEHGYKVERCLIVSLKRGVEITEAQNLDEYFRVFLSLLDIYRTLNIKGGVLGEDI